MLSAAAAAISVPDTVALPCFATAGFGSTVICVGSSAAVRPSVATGGQFFRCQVGPERLPSRPSNQRSEEHTSELQSLMRISYAVFCLKKKTHTTQQATLNNTHKITCIISKNKSTNRM